MEWENQTDGESTVKETEAFCAYLKSEEFVEFMNLWRQQYETYGCFKGSITLKLDTSNRFAIEGFLGKSFHQETIVRITWKQVQKAIASSKFEGADFYEVMNLYFGEKIIAKKAIRQEKEDRFLSACEQMQANYINTVACDWFINVLHEKSSIYSRLKQEFEKSSSQWTQEVTWCMDALNALPHWENQHESMAVFAARITGDPHAFDQTTFLFYLLFHGICFLCHLPYQNYRGIEKNQILYQVGLSRDQGNNYCMLCHINAMKQHISYPAWRGFYENYEIWNVNMYNLNEITSIDPASCQRVVVLENPSVFELLAKQAKQERYDHLGLLCTNGQLNLSAYTLLDRIVEAGISLFYCGDMDPEGLLIADRLWVRYQDRLHLWHYERSDYEQAISTQTANASRLKKLEKLQNKQLQFIASILLETGLIAYQENLLSRYQKDLAQLNQEAIHEI